jgi:thiol-disulfide isomerase/thioredoxin
MIILANEKEFVEFFVNHDLAIVKYHSDNDCPDCEKILPVYERISREPQYQHIKFACMSADNNPNARELIKKRKLPFAAAYKKGLLVQGDTVTSAQDIINILESLPHIYINL